MFLVSVARKLLSSANLPLKSFISPASIHVSAGLWPGEWIFVDSAAIWPKRVDVCRLATRAEKSEIY